MATQFNTLIKDVPSWLSMAGDKEDIVIYTMGRLVRNLPGHPFPGWSTDEHRTAVVDTLLPKLVKSHGFKTAFHAEMPELDLEQRRLLLERRLITPSMAARQEGCHVIIPRKQNVSVMINEEEHLVAQFYRQGLALEGVMKDMTDFAANLEKEFTFAKDDEMGYLTSMPNEAGEGMQLHAVLHLPALTIANHAEQISHALKKLEMNKTPYYTGMGQNTGNTYILFTPAMSFYEAEDAFYAFEALVDTFVTREQQLRERLIKDDFLDLSDRVGRALGLLCYGMKLSFEEQLDNLSMLRLGHQCNLFQFDKNEMEPLHEFALQNLLFAPAHLRLQMPSTMPKDFTSMMRSMHVKKYIGDYGSKFRFNSRQ